MKLEVTVLYRHDLGEVPAVPVRGTCELAAIGADELDSCAHIRPLSDVKRAQFARRLAAGDECWVARLDGVPVHYAWVQRARAHVVQPAGRRYPLRAGELWIYDCRTAEAARGRKVYPFVLSRLLDTYGARGFRRAYIYTSTKNVASQRGILGAGFRLRARLYALAIGERFYPLAPPWRIR